MTWGFHFSQWRAGLFLQSQRETGDNFMSKMGQGKPFHLTIFCQIWKISPNSESCPQSIMSSQRAKFPRKFKLPQILSSRIFEAVFNPSDLIVYSDFFFSPSPTLNFKIHWRSICHITFISVIYFHLSLLKSFKWDANISSRHILIMSKTMECLRVFCQNLNSRYFNFNFNNCHY